MTARTIWLGLLLLGSSAMIGNHVWAAEPPAWLLGEWVLNSARTHELQPEQSAGIDSVVTGFLELCMRIIFKMYGKNVTILTKKIAAACRKPA